MSRLTGNPVIQNLLARSRPGAIDPAYARRPDQLPPAPVYAERGLFPVLVTYVSGDMGGPETTCAAAYKVTKLDGTTVLGDSDPGSTPAGTPIQPAKPRPVGLMIAGATYGTAFLETDGSFILWDAGEVPDAGGACA
ncbi:MAG: hypothetical protein PHU85_10425 [Phycisphaerae bacterium]|nr:hypothetical protein [Phycisphaerae bacterium]